MANYIKSSMIPVDKEKILAIMKTKGINQSELCRRCGYALGSISYSIRQGHFTNPMWMLVSKELGITLEDIAPDPKSEPVSEPEQKDDPVPAAEDMEFFRMFSEKMDEAIRVLRESRKTVSEETIAQGVNWGMEMFWSNHKKEFVDLLLKNVKGAIFSGNLEAMKKHDEILDERYPYREYIAPTENGRPD